MNTCLRASALAPPKVRLQAIAGFNSLTFGGEFLRPKEEWSIGRPGFVPYGVATTGVGANEPIHNNSRSIM